MRDYKNTSSTDGHTESPYEQFKKFKEIQESRKSNQAGKFETYSGQVAAIKSEQENEEMLARIKQSDLIEMTSTPGALPSRKPLIKI